MFAKRTRLVGLTVLLLIASLVAVVTAAAGAAGSGNPSSGKVLEVEVAEDVTKVVFDEAPVFDDGYPAHGNPFITQGYIYPKGTLNGTNGVTIIRDEKTGEITGSEPEFPDKVVGTWICYGRAIGEGAHAETGAWAVSTQIFQFNDVYQGATLVTTGFETLKLNAPVERAITGGTGRYQGARGQVTQELFGMTADMGVNLRFSIALAGSK